MADFVLISLHWWLAYLCCAAQYGYATWCESPWLEDVIKKQVWKEDRKHLKRLVLWVIEFCRNNNNKTPKRHFDLTTMGHCATERVWDRPQEEVSAQRWKRKNRVKQLKRSLHRYKHGTNLPFYSHELHAYLQLQALHRPTEKTPVKKWESYILELSGIIAHLEEARTWAHLAKRRKQEEEAKRQETEK